LGATADQRNAVRSVDENMVSNSKAPVTNPDKHIKKTTQKRLIKGTKKPNPRKRNKNQPTQHSINKKTAIA